MFWWFFVGISTFSSFNPRPSFSLEQTSGNAVSNNKTGPLLLDHLMRRQVLAAFYRSTQPWFPVNALKSLHRVILNTFGSLEMHSKRRYKICTCSLSSTSGNLRLFETRAVLLSQFPKILDAIARFTKVRIFLFPLTIIFLNPKILGFPFYEN